MSNQAARVLVVLGILFGVGVTFFNFVPKEPKKEYVYSVLSNNVLFICKDRYNNDLVDCTASLLGETVTIKEIHNAQNIIVEEVK